MRKTFIALLISLSTIMFSTAQSSFVPGERCGINQVQSELANNNPQYLQELKDFQDVIKQFSSRAPAGRATTLTIPVVVHVMHLASEAVGNGRNISDARVQAQIQILNRDFMALNSNYTSGTPSVFQSIRGIPEIQFCLATVDPSGNPTTGIDRQVATDPSSTNTIENTIKPATTWNANKYLNIWTLPIPGTTAFGGTLGYAYLPTFGMVGSNKDGIVIDYRFFGSPATGASTSCRSLTHETGHYLGLNHIWGDTDGSTSSPHVCNDDDGIADTPVQLGPTADNTSFNCSSGVPPTSCSSTKSMYCDYMDYLNNDACYSTFSQGQVNVMRNVTQGTSITVNGLTYSGRSSLLTSQVTACSTSGCTLTAAITPTTTTCNLANGAATVVPTGGSGTYLYTWSNGGSTASISGLASGTYKVTVTSGSCSATATGTVATSTNVSATASATAVSSCGANNGTANVTPSGGSSYSYVWSNGRLTASITGLAVGSYTVTVTSGTCSATATAKVTATNGISATTTGNPVSACGANNGTATVSASGGTSYSYVWSTSQTSATISGLSAGTYTVTVSAGGCNTTASYTVGNSSGITANIAGTNTTCGKTNGTVSVNPTGATSFSYLWSNSKTTSSIGNLPSGTYTVTITSGACSTTASFNVSGSTPLTVSTTSTPNTSTSNNGTATAVASNGTSPYFYSWSDGQNTQTATGLSSGQYSVTASDQFGCTATQLVTVSNSIGIAYNSNIASINIFPNPTEKTLNIEVQCKINDDITIELMNLSGQILNHLFFEKTQSKELSLNVETLPAGFYLVRVKTNNGQIVTKVIKQ